VGHAALSRVSPLLQCRSTVRASRAACNHFMKSSHLTRRVWALLFDEVLIYLVTWKNFSRIIRNILFENWISSTSRYRAPPCHGN